MNSPFWKASPETGGATHATIELAKIRALRELRHRLRAWKTNTVTYPEVSEIHGTPLGPSFLLLLILGFLVFQLIGFKRRREPLLLTWLVLSSRLFNLSNNLLPVPSNRMYVFLLLQIQ